MDLPQADPDNAEISVMVVLMTDAIPGVPKQAWHRRNSEAVVAHSAT
jgi:hypothetical protein